MADYDLPMSTACGCVWEVLSQDTLVISYCDDASTPEQWRNYVRMMRGFQGRDDTRFLVYAHAVPPREVLGEISSVARGQSWRVALISTSAAVRFAASTFSFVARNFRFFTPDRVTDALLHLRCDKPQQELARSALNRMLGSEARSAPPR